MAVEHARIGGQVSTLHSPARKGLSSLRDAETQGTPHIHISPALSLAISGDHFLPWGYPHTAAREVQGARRSLSLGTEFELRTWSPDTPSAFSVLYLYQGLHRESMEGSNFTDKDNGDLLRIHKEECTPQAHM